MKKYVKRMLLSVSLTTLLFSVTAQAQTGCIVQYDECYWRTGDIQYCQVLLNWCLKGKGNGSVDDIVELIAPIQVKPIITVD